MRPTARVRQNRVLKTTAKLCRQYLKWFGNSSYKPARNGERWLLDALRAESIRTLLDAGANVGTWSLMAADLFPAATIYALEVVPETAATLRERAGQRDRVRCFNLGLAAHTGTLSLRYHPAASTHATFTDYPHSWVGERIECPVMRGDDFLAREGIREVDFLKLDVEGAEHLVLQGLEDSLRGGRVRFVQFEYGRVNILTHFLLRDFYQLFSTYGYVVGKIYPDYVDFREYDLNDEDFLGPNYLACRAEDEALGRLGHNPSLSRLMTTAELPSRTYLFLVAGELRRGGDSVEIRSPYSGDLVGRAGLAGPDDVAAALDAAVAAGPAAAALPSHARAAVLERIAAGVAERRESLAGLLAAEAGKPLALARAEIDRAVFVFRQGAQEAVRMGGEVIPMDLQPHGERRWGITRRFPLSPISAIIPFNFPVLLAAHKLAPAVACGATMLLKVPPQDPLASLLLGEIIRESGYPAGAISILLCTNEVAAPLIDDPRVRMITFTGSARAGWAIRKRAFTRRVTLELGGNAAVMIEPDADLDHAVKRCVAGGYLYAGQSCISTQRILVHQSLYSRFVERFVPAVAALRTGDPMAETTDVGPMIDQASAERAAEWIAEAAADGAKVAAGGKREGAVLQPTVLLDTTGGMRVNCEEIFAPVTTVRPYPGFDEAVAAVNDSPYGIQAGLFTNDMRTILRAFERIEVGGLVINDVPGFRVDHAPYGGVKESGQGREGVRYAIEEMTELKLLVLGET